MGTDQQPALTAQDLAELVARFNEVTGKLQESHVTLQAEVARLRRELGEANEQLRRSERLAALGEMAAGIAHEIRNPLGSIGLYAEMLRDDLAQMPAQQGLAKKIGSAVRGLDAIVSDVLSFSREIRLRRFACDGVELVQGAFDACRAQAKNVRVCFEMGDGGGDGGGGDGGGHVELTCDARLVRQALVNVIRNALEAMAEEPGSRHTLTLGVSRRRSSVAVGAVRADGAGREGVAVLSVSDTGPGMSEEAIERMFNPFFTTRATGTGLGLAIVHRIVDAHDGRVSVKSKPGLGTTVELLLPMDVELGGETELVGAGVQESVR